MGNVARVGNTRNACRILVRKPVEKVYLINQKKKWEDNINMNLRERGSEDEKCTQLALMQ
jgi:hypothetical protein